MKKNIVIALLAFISISCAVLGASCTQKETQLTPAPELPAYNESEFEGSGIVGISSLLDMVGYGKLSSYTFYSDGAVGLESKFFVPLKNSRTNEGFSATLTLERQDGVFDVMTESANTGALYVMPDDHSDDIMTRYRIYVVGIDAENSYIVISGEKKHKYDTDCDYFERRYLVPLGDYCTGSPIDMQVVYFENAYYITLKTSNNGTVFKKIDKNTEFVQNPSFSLDLGLFFDDVDRVLGLESLDMQAKFSSVSFTTGNEKVQNLTNVEKHTVSQVNETPDGGSLSLSNENPDKGQSVIVSVKPNIGYYLDTFKVNGENRKYRLQSTDNGTYQYEIIAVQKDTLVEVSYAIGNEQLYTITGTYSYTSGIYNPDTNRFENEGDVVSVRAGTYIGTAENGEFSIDLPNGYYEIELVSEKFPATKTALTVEKATDIGEIKFNRLNFTEGISYNADNSLSFNAKKTNRLFEEEAATEGFVVNYTVKGGLGGYFNTGGLYIQNQDETYDYIFVYHSNGKAQIVFIDSNYKWHNGPSYTTSHPYSDCMDEIQVSIIFFKGQYHFVLDGEYACTVDAATRLNTAQGELGEDYFAEKPRMLGLRSFDSSVTFTNISYGLGDESAEAAMDAKGIKFTENHGLDAGEAELLAGEPTAKAGEGFVVNFTLGNSLNPGAYFNNGGLYVELGNGNYHKFAFNTKHDDRTCLRLTIYESTSNTQMNILKEDCVYDGTTAVDITIAFYNGTYYIKFGTYTMSFDVSMTYQFIDASKIFDTAQTRKIGLCGAIETTGANLTNVTYEIGNQAAISAITNMGINVTEGYRVVGGAHQILFGEPTAQANEGFVVNFTLKASNNDGAYFDNGGLYVELGNGNYHKITFNEENAKLRISINESTTNANVNMPQDYSYTTTEDVDVTIVFYNGTYYIKFGTYTVSYDVSMSYKYIDATKVFDTTQTRKIGVCGAINTTTAMFEDVECEIGNQVAVSAITNMGMTTAEGYRVVGGAHQILFGEPTAKAGEGFVVNFTLKASNNDGAYFNNGGLYVEMGNGNNHKIVFNQNGGKLMISIWESTKNIQFNKAYEYAYTTTEDVDVTIVFYNGTYYVKFGTYTISYDATMTYQYIDTTKIFDTTQTRKLGVCGAINTTTAIFEDVACKIGTEEAKSAVDAIVGLNYNVNQGSYQLLAGEPTAKANEGFVVNFTLKASNNDGAYFNNGGLYVELGNGNSHKIVFNQNGGKLMISIWESTKSTQFNTAYEYAYTTANDANVTIAFYNGTYYIKFGTYTVSYNATMTYKYIDTTKIFDMTQTRKLGVCGAINTTNAKFEHVTYEIGTEKAKKIISNMGFQLS